MNDHIVNEIRNYRDEHAKRFNYDIDLICDDFKTKHQLYVKKLKNEENKKPENIKLEY